MYGKGIIKRKQYFFQEVKSDGLQEFDQAEKGKMDREKNILQG